MPIYKHLGTGHYIGSCIVIVANSKKDAENIIRKELDESGLKTEMLDITTYPIPKYRKRPLIIHSDSGNY